MGRKFTTTSSFYNETTNPFFKQKAERIRKEIQETNKYPASFQYLPVDIYERFKTDNENILSVDRYPTEIDKDGHLCIKNELLGINNNFKKQLFKNLTVDIEWGILYILHAKGTKLYKIGVTTDFKKRFRDITCASPIPICVLKHAQCDNPHLLERSLHEMFAAKLAKNEWFQLTDDELFRALAFVDQFYNV